MTDTPSAASAPHFKYGKFSHRILAATIDLSLILMVALPLVDMFAGQFLPAIDAQKIVDVVDPLRAKYDGHGLMEQIGDIFRDPSFQAVIRKQKLIQRMIVENLMQVGVFALYMIPFWARYSATPGKMLFRLEIRDAVTLDPMSERQCIRRFLGYIVSALPFSAGFLWIMANQKHRGFHDYIANTVVIIKPGNPFSSTRQSAGP